MQVCKAISTRSKTPPLSDWPFPLDRKSSRRGGSSLLLKVRVEKRKIKKIPYVYCSKNVTSNGMVSMERSVVMKVTSVMSVVSLP